METTLMMVTVVALALAIGMSGVAWRLLRENRVRSNARAQALQAMASERRPSRSAAVDEGLEEAWDFALAPEPEAPLPVRRKHTSESPNFLRADTRQARLPEGMFGSTVAVRVGAPPRRWLALAVVGVVMASIVSAVYTFYRPVIAAESGGTVETSARTPGPHPIELLSLRQNAGPDGSFSVTGLVQNPAGGQTVRKAVAVVYLFDHDGNYFGGGKAALELTSLQPGEQSPFVVRVSNAGKVSRYRVGFRSEDGGVVAHVDRRGQLPGGMTGDVIDTPTAQRATPRRPESLP